MCRFHWRQVPADLRRSLWANYKPEQEHGVPPTTRYLAAAEACITYIASKERKKPAQRSLPHLLVKDGR